MDSILTNMRHTVPKFNVIGNRRIGNAGTEHLHLLADTATDLDLSDYGVTAAGVRNVCDFLITNKSITRRIMWGNAIGDEGAKAIGDMLRVNKTLRELFIDPGSDASIGPVGFSHLSDGLTHNNTLRDLSVAFCGNVGDIHVRNLCPELSLNRGLETLDLRQTSITETGSGYFLQCMQDNIYLKFIRMVQPMNDEDYIDIGPKLIWSKLTYWLQLNRLNRKLIRDENLNHADWTNAVIQSSEANNLCAIYLFVRNKPELLC